SQALSSPLKQKGDSQKDSRSDRSQGTAEAKSAKCEELPAGTTEPAAIRSDGIEVAGGLSEQRVDWLKSLLQSYPGSRWGNRETRGLDTTFASDTYVPTALEESLLEAIRTARVRLVILCGNAGDGKTALLQHL